MPLYQHYADLAGNPNANVLPTPCFNVINGGEVSTDELQCTASLNAFHLPVLIVLLSLSVSSVFVAVLFIFSWMLCVPTACWQCPRVPRVLHHPHRCKQLPRGDADRLRGLPQSERCIFCALCWGGLPSRPRPGRKCACLACEMFNAGMHWRLRLQASSRPSMAATQRSSVTREALPHQSMPNPAWLFSWRPPKKLATSTRSVSDSMLLRPSSRLMAKTRAYHFEHLTLFSSVSSESHCDNTGLTECFFFFFFFCSFRSGRSRLLFVHRTAIVRQLRFGLQRRGRQGLVPDHLR